MTDDRCKTCRFWHPINERDQLGECREDHPAVAVFLVEGKRIAPDPEALGQWPRTFAHYGCGKHKPLEAAEMEMVGG